MKTRDMFEESAHLVLGDRPRPYTEGDMADVRAAFQHAAQVGPPDWHRGPWTDGDAEWRGRPMPRGDADAAGVTAADVLAAFNSNPSSLTKEMLLSMRKAAEARLAEIIGRAPTTVEAYMLGRNEPPHEVIRALADAPAPDAGPEEILP